MGQEGVWRATKKPGTGVSRVLVDAGFDPSASRLFARIVYWLILLLLVIAAVESLGLEGVLDTLATLIAYLPNILAAALILILGSLLTRRRRRSVRTDCFWPKDCESTGSRAAWLCRRWLLPAVAFLSCFWV